MPQPTLTQTLSFTRSQGAIALIDIGSNSMRLVVFDALKRAPVMIYNEKVQCQLGKGLSKTGKLNPKGTALALATMPRFLSLCEQMDVLEVHIFATAAVREASDGAAFIRTLSTQFQIDVEVISGVREAELGAYGILCSMRVDKGICADLGGGSLELVGINKGDVSNKATLPLGVLKLADDALPSADRKQIIQQALEAANWARGHDGQALHVIGGSFRALARLHMAAEHYPLRIIHEYTVSAKRLRKFLSSIHKMDTAKLAKQPGISNKRLGMIPIAAHILALLIDHIAPSRVVFSGSGIREGYLYTKLSPHVRKQDG